MNGDLEKAIGCDSRSVNQKCTITTLTFANEPLQQSFSCAYWGDTFQTRTVGVFATCGPEPFVIAHETIIAKQGQTSFTYFCQIPEGTKDDFLYSWSEGKTLLSSFQESRALKIDEVKDGSTEYTCHIKNRHTNQTAKFVMLLIADNSEYKKPVLWIALPSALAVVAIPLIYLAYLKSNGEFEFKNLFQNKTFNDDEVDYVVTQSGESKRAEKKMMSTLLRHAVSRVSQPLSRGSIVVSLPIATRESMIMNSKFYRKNRADLFTTMKFNPLFKRPSRLIKKQVLKKSDSEYSWVGDCIRKVENWDSRHSDSNLSNHSQGTIENLLDATDAFKKWNRTFIANASRLRYGPPSTKDQWLEMHRFINSDLTKNAHSKRFDDHTIADLSNRLTEMYFIAKPNKTHFPTVKRIGDPFHSMLCDPTHKSHHITKIMWDEYMDRMFSIAYDVGTFNKLSRKVLERTLYHYGNPEKIRKIVNHQANEMLKT